MRENEDLAEVISEILIQMHGLEARMARIDKRMEFTIKRMVKAESRLEVLDKISNELDFFKREQLSLNEKFVDYMMKKPL